MNFAVIGAGNGGLALSGHLSSMGHTVMLYDRSVEKVDNLNANKEIRITGALNAVGKITFASIDLNKVIKDADVIMVATTATAHRSIAKEMSKGLRDNQIILLNPGRTCGAIEFKNTLNESGCNAKVFVAEAQTLVYACRSISPNEVNIIGVKERVLISSYPAFETEFVLSVLKPVFPCFFAAKNVLQTSFENIGAIFHPAVVLFNATTIERGQDFYFYRDMTDGLSRLIEAIDNERLSVAHAYGIKPISAFEWVSYAYDGVKGDTLCERMHNNPAYYEILAPNNIDCRQITEDIPTGIIPMAELGRAAGIHTPLFDALTVMCSVLLNSNFREEGRTLDRLGLGGCTSTEILNKIH